MKIQLCILSIMLIFGQNPQLTLLLRACLLLAKKCEGEQKLSPLFLHTFSEVIMVLCNIVQAFSHNSKQAFSPIFIRAISCVAALFILIFY